MGALALGFALSPMPATAQTDTVLQEAEGGIALGVGKGTLVRLPRAVSSTMPFIGVTSIAAAGIVMPSIDLIWSMFCATRTLAE